MQDNEEFDYQHYNYFMSEEEKIANETPYEKCIRLIDSIEERMKLLNETMKQQIAETQEMINKLNDYDGK